VVVQGAQQAAPEAQAAALAGSPAAAQPVVVVAAHAQPVAAVEQAAHSQRPRIRRGPMAVVSVVATLDGAWDSAGSPCWATDAARLGRAQNARHSIAMLPPPEAWAWGPDARQVWPDWHAL
jgi:hypothetical protein